MAKFGTGELYATDLCLNYNGGCMEEQIELALEDLMAEKQELQQKVSTLQQQLHQQRFDFLQEKNWRIHFNIIVLNHEAGEVQQELATFTNGKEIKVNG